MLVAVSLREAKVGIAFAAAAILFATAGRGGHGRAARADPPLPSFTSDCSDADGAREQPSWLHASDGQRLYAIHGGSGSRGVVLVPESPPGDVCGWLPYAATLEDSACASSRSTTEGRAIRPCNAVGRRSLMGATLPPPSRGCAPMERKKWPSSARHSAAPSRWRMPPASTASSASPARPLSPVSRRRSRCRIPPERPAVDRWFAHRHISPGCRCASSSAAPARLPRASRCTRARGTAGRSSTTRRTCAERGPWCSRGSARRPPRAARSESAGSGRRSGGNCETRRGWASWLVTSAEPGLRA